MFTAKQIEPAIKPDAECERILMLGGWGCRYDLRQRRREKCAAFDVAPEANACPAVARSSSRGPAASQLLAAFSSSTLKHLLTAGWKRKRVRPRSSGTRPAPCAPDTTRLACGPGARDQAHAEQPATAWPLFQAHVGALGPSPAACRGRRAHHRATSEGPGHFAPAFLLCRGKTRERASTIGA